MILRHQRSSGVSNEQPAFQGVPPFQVPESRDFLTGWDAKKFRFEDKFPSRMVSLGSCPKQSLAECVLQTLYLSKCHIYFLYISPVIQGTSSTCLSLCWHGVSVCCLFQPILQRIVADFVGYLGINSPVIYPQNKFYLQRSKVQVGV